MRKYLNLKANMAFGLTFAFLVNSLGPLPMAQADEFILPAAGVRVSLSPHYNPPILKGLKVHPDNPFKFEFILDQGDSTQKQDQLRTDASRLIKYFLASLTIPEKDLWVNLSPYEKNRIVPESFGQTEMGRDLLAEDYMLKQITASLIYPEDTTGKKFWKRIYAEAYKRFGTTNIPVNTFNKVWIIPEKAVVYENAKEGTAYVVESKLKVMLEEDYLALEKNNEKNMSFPNASVGNTGNAQTLDPRQKHSGVTDVSSLGSKIVREIVIPELTKEVNEGKNFAQLRQVYNSLILATWYKKKIKDSILAQVYEDKKKVAGVGYKISSTLNIEGIYQRYLQAFKKGVYNYIKEGFDPATQETVPRKYFSGGFAMMASKAMLTVTDAAQLPVDPSKDLKLTVDLSISTSGRISSKTMLVATRGTTEPHQTLDRDPDHEALEKLVGTFQAAAYQEASGIIREKEGVDLSLDQVPQSKYCQYISPVFKKYFEQQGMASFMPVYVPDELSGEDQLSIQDQKVPRFHYFLIVMYKNEAWVIDPSWQQFADVKDKDHPILISRVSQLEHELTHLGIPAARHQYWFEAIKRDFTIPQEYKPKNTTNSQAQLASTSQPSRAMITIDDAKKERLTHFLLEDVAKSPGHDVDINELARFGETLGFTRTEFWEVIRALSHAETFKPDPDTYTSFLETSHEDGTLTERVKEYWAIKKDRNWGRFADIFVFNSSGKLYLQSRRVGGYLDTSVGGSIDLGLDGIGAAIKEAKEEFELDVNASDLVPVRNPNNAKGYYNYDFGKYGREIKQTYRMVLTPDQEREWKQRVGRHIITWDEYVHSKSTPPLNKEVAAIVEVEPQELVQYYFTQWHPEERLITLAWGLNGELAHESIRKELIANSTKSLAMVSKVKKDNALLSFRYDQLVSFGLTYFIQGAQALVHIKAGWPFVLKHFPNNTDFVPVNDSYRIAFKKLAGIVLDFNFVNYYPAKGDVEEAVVMRKADNPDLRAEFEILLKSGNIKGIKTLIDQYFELLMRMIKLGVLPADCGFQNFGIYKGRLWMIDPGEIKEKHFEGDIDFIKEKFDENEKILFERLGSKDLLNYYFDKLEETRLDDRRIARTISRYWATESATAEPMGDMSKEIVMSLSNAMINDTVENGSTWNGRHVAFDKYLMTFLKEEHAQHHSDFNHFADIGIGMSGAPTFFEWFVTLLQGSNISSTPDSMSVVGLDASPEALTHAHIRAENQFKLFLDNYELRLLPGGFNSLSSLVGRFGNFDVVRSLNVFRYRNDKERNYFRQNVLNALREGGFFIEGDGAFYIIYQKQGSRLPVRQIIFNPNNPVETLQTHFEDLYKRLELLKDQRLSALIEALRSGIHNPSLSHTDKVPIDPNFMQFMDNSHTGLLIFNAGKSLAMNTQVSHAQLSLKGGIDLTPAHLNVKIKAGSTTEAFGDDKQMKAEGDRGIKFHLDAAMLAQLQNAPGLVPVIVHIEPLGDLRKFLGVQDNLAAA